MAACPTYPCPPFTFLAFADTASTEVYTLSLPTLFRSGKVRRFLRRNRPPSPARRRVNSPSGSAACSDHRQRDPDRSEEQRLNSSHSQISYAVFRLKNQTAARGANARAVAADGSSQRRR